MFLSYNFNFVAASNDETKVKVYKEFGFNSDGSNRVTLIQSI